MVKLLPCGHETLSSRRLPLIFGNCGYDTAIACDSLYIFLRSPVDNQSINFDCDIPILFPLPSGSQRFLAGKIINDCPLMSIVHPHSTTMFQSPHLTFPFESPSMTPCSHTHSTHYSPHQGFSPSLMSHVHPCSTCSTTSGKCCPSKLVPLLLDSGSHRQPCEWIGGGPQRHPTQRRSSLLPS